ncbi:uncharacterized protein LOC109828099 isoform X2 [Asparagus officinalis]|uniref:uncharacterized protein LOC109828099 isoform X2 n=1 Tax=Asparagus officinalis TaxID=4686 RepID=UPI00098E06D4|nr:uncharacterized protein LOC109828099 isoform X2 [Asparagus officinalis]
MDLEQGIRLRSLLPLYSHTFYMLCCTDMGASAGMDTDMGADTGHNKYVKDNNDTSNEVWIWLPWRALVVFVANSSLQQKGIREPSMQILHHPYASSLALLIVLDSYDILRNWWWLNLHMSR